MFVAARERPAGPWACLARSSPTPFGIACGPTIRCAVSNALRTVSVNRRLTTKNMRRIGAALRNAEKDGEIWPPAIALTRFLLVPAGDRAKVLGLQASEIDLGRRTATLGDSKDRALGAPTVQFGENLLRSAMMAKPSPTAWSSRPRAGAVSCPAIRKFWERIAQAWRITRRRHSSRLSAFLCVARR